MSNIYFFDTYAFFEIIIGYTVARRYNIPFLTGDNDFKDMPYVEFVK